MQLAYTKISLPNLCNLHKRKTRRAAVASAGENVFMKNAQKYRVDFSTLYLPDLFPEFGNLVIID